MITFIEILINLILSCIIQAPHPICTKNIAYLTINSKSQRNISKLISFIPITFAIAHIMYIGHGWISLLDNEIQSKNIKLKWFLLFSYFICPCPMLSSYIFQIQFQICLFRHRFKILDFPPLCKVKEISPCQSQH